MTEYNSEAFNLAHQRFLTAAKQLTDDDLAQFAIVDPKFAERARAKRAGFVEADEEEDEATKKALAKPLTGQFMVRWMRDHFGPVFAAHRYRSKQFQSRLEAFEERENQRAFMVANLENEIRSLKAIVLELQADRAVTR